MAERERTLYEKLKAEKPPVLELAAEYLDGERLSELSGFVDFLAEHKMTPRLYATNLYQVKYRGEYVMKIRLAEGPKLTRGIYTVYVWTADSDSLDGYLAPLGDELKRFYLENIRLCERCSKCPPKSMTVLGNTVENYCGTYMGVHNPTARQYEFLKRFVFLRRDYLK